MIKILYAYFGEKACVKLAALVGGTCHNTNKSRYTHKQKDSIIIRWGSPHQIEHAVQSPVANGVQKILLSSDKARARDIMRDAGVSVPKQFNFTSKDLPCIARPSIHSQGSDFYLCKTMKDVERARSAGCTYFSCVFAKTHEFRVHVASGKILFIQNKPLRNGVPDNDAPWTILNWDEYNMEVCTQALKAVDAFDLDFAAVDVMWNSRTKKACVCELNTAPALESDFQRNKYAMYFKWLERTKIGQCWNWKKFKNPDSLAWRNFQLAQDIPEGSRE